MIEIKKHKNIINIENGFIFVDSQFEQLNFSKIIERTFGKIENYTSSTPFIKENQSKSTNSDFFEF